MSSSASGEAMQNALAAGLFVLIFVFLLFLRMLPRAIEVAATGAPPLS
jgi:hypothetical protein